MSAPNGPQGDKDFAEHLGSEMENGAALNKIRTAGSVSISPELFEKLYLQPRDAAAPSSAVRKIVGNPTPVCLIGFLMSLTPLSCDLMGWRGAGEANGSASIGAYLFFGGVLMNVGAVGEWIVGNTFPTVVFASFGAFWLTYGATLQPFYSVSANYAIANDKPAAMGSMEPGFLSAFAFILLWMGFMCFIYLIVALRTNIVFCFIFLCLILTFVFLAGAFWQMANGEMALGMNLVVGGGACGFATTCFGWYLFASILMASLDFPFGLPVGDISHIIKGKTEKSKV